MGKIRFKRGISLIVLIITIVIALIILGATIVQINSSMENADIVSFAEDLTIVQDSVNMHYIQNDEIPYIEPEEVFSQNQIVNIKNRVPPLHHLFSLPQIFSRFFNKNFKIVASVFLILSF